MLRAIAPAPLLDTVALYQRGPLIRRFELKAVMLQLQRSDTWGFVDQAGMLMAAVGLWPLDPEAPGEELHEFWFVSRPEVARHLPSLIRLARLTCARVAHSASVRIRAHVRDGDRAGQRLCTLAGFRHQRTDHGWERWEWRNSSKG
jgi:hypothetical protein